VGIKVDISVVLKRVLKKNQVSTSNCLVCLTDGQGRGRAAVTDRAGQGRAAGAGQARPGKKTWEILGYGFQDMVFRTWDLNFGAWIFTLAVSKTET
jgi:hypothetical protein